MIRFGPAGLGGVKEAIANLEEYAKMGLTACEIAFTYGVYIKTKEDAERIGKKAKELGIELSIHAPYFINLNSAEEEKIEKSKERILRCLETGTWLGASRVVFHAGFYGKDSEEKTYETIKEGIVDIMEKAKEEGYTPKIAPEIMGKNVFGKIDEIAKLVEDTGCSFCIDFAHILARYKDYNFKKVLEKFDKYDTWHCHFSGIEYGEKGEKNHILTHENEWKKVLENLPKNKNITIINESPSPVADSAKGLLLYKSLK